MNIVTALDGTKLDYTDIGALKEYLFEKIRIVKTNYVPSCGGNAYIDITIDCPEFIQQFDGSFTIDVKD